MPINEWNMILSFKKVKHWFLVVKGVNYSTKIDLIELSRSKWSHPIQIKALIIKVWKNIVKPNGTNRKDQKMASESPGLVKTVFKTNRRIFLKLMHNHMHIQPTFLNKKLRGCVTLKRFSRQNFFKKWTFFKFFCIFEISLMSWFEKWSYFLILKKIWSQTSKNPTFEANRSLVIAFRIIVNIFLCILKVFEVFSTDL